MFSVCHFCLVVASSFLAVASRNNLSNVVVDLRRSISFALERLTTDSISPYELVGSIGDDELGLIFDRDQFL